MSVIDTHCHLNDDKLYPRAEQIIWAFDSDNIECALCVGNDALSSERAVELADKFKAIYATAGIHPHDASTADVAKYECFMTLARNPKVAAVGEIGLDYYYDLSPRDVQKRVFIEQLELASSLALPVVLHIRDAYEDARKILFDNKSKLSYGIMLHCYSGSAQFVKIFDKLDAYYSFGGALTFKNAVRNIEALKEVPLDRLLLETDCPYMTPVPFRGKTNEPKYIDYVASKMSEVLDIEREQIDEITTKNAKTLFTRIK